MKKYLKKNKNLNIILSTISVVLIWRGVWHIADMFFYDGFAMSKFLSDFVPMMFGFTYLLINDSKLTELMHSNETEE